jgi:NAD(P)-dependent dehydrogenase (short-subunit alcohol dehydrogenase family)
LDAVILNLASEYAKSNIRFNAVAPGAVDTPLYNKTQNDFMKTLSPMGVISEAKDIAELSFTLLKLATSPERCCTSTAVRMWAGGSRQRFAAGTAEATLVPAEGSKKRPPDAGPFRS